VQYISASGKTLAITGLILISPVALLFSRPAAIGFSSDMAHLFGAVPASLAVAGAVAMFALYKLHHPS
jgi:hypothetical protein